MDDTERALITRRWTDDNIIERDASALATVTPENVLSVERQRELKQYYETSDEAGASAQDFEVATVAGEQLQQRIDQCDEELKPSKLQKFGVTHKSRKAKATEVLRTSSTGGLSELNVYVNSLESEWKEKHGQVFRAFQRICRTLDDHRSVLKIFPSQNDYASPIVGSVTILMKAAKTHTEVSILLSKSIAEIFDKVATCSGLIRIIKTPRTRQKLADIYARMFLFYQRTLEWYLQSRFGRLWSSFSENLLKEFEDAKEELEDSISELYREAAVASTAMVAMVNGKMAHLEHDIWQQRKNFEIRDTMAEQRMQKMMQATWTEVKQLKSIIERAAIAPSSTPGLPSVSIEEPISNYTTDYELLQSAGKILETFISVEEGPNLFNQGRFWMPEKETVLKLQAWISEGSVSRVMWISSPHESKATISGSHAAARITVAAAWQAEAPIISAFCTRPRPSQLHSRLSVEHTGLISLAYGLIRQLLQFHTAEKRVALTEDDIKTLDGAESSWPSALRILGLLLGQLPDVAFCVIDGLNEFEWGSGGTWTKQFVEILQAKQQMDGSFNILFTTTGQSRVLPQFVANTDRHMATKKAVEVGRSQVTNAIPAGIGRRIEQV